MDATIPFFRFSATIFIESVECAEVAVTDELAPSFIPETEGERFEAREKLHWFHCLKQRIRVMAFLQVVIGNPRTEMMDVMKADVAGEPLQHPGKFKEGTALQRRRRVIPLVAPLPVHSLELMLHVK